MVANPYAACGRSRETGATRRVIEALLRSRGASMGYH